MNKDLKEDLLEYLEDYGFNFEDALLATDLYFQKGIEAAVDSFKWVDFVVRDYGEEIGNVYSEEIGNVYSEELRQVILDWQNLPKLPQVKIIKKWKLNKT